MLRIITFLLLAGAALYNFELQTAVALVVLLLLIFVQAGYLSSHIRTVKKNPPVDSNQVAELLSEIEREATAEKAQSRPVKAVNQHIEPEVFKQFQENLDRSKIDQSAKKQEADVVLSLSRKQKKAPVKTTTKTQNKPTSKSSKTVGKAKESGYKRYGVNKNKKAETTKKTELGTVDVGSIDALFDDIDEGSGEQFSRGTVTPNPRKSMVTSTAIKNTHSPLIAKEELSSDDLKPDKKSMEKEVDLILSVGEKSIKAQDYGVALQKVQHWLQTNDKNSASTEQLKAILLLKIDCELGLQQFDSAAKTGQDILKHYFSPVDEKALVQVELWNKKFIAAKKQSLALHFLFTALNDYRIRNNDLKLDQTYIQIEKAYQQLEDWPRMIQTLQNHINIKKNLKDYEGQLSLLDHLGKLLYDQGDAKGSKRCYEQSIAIKNQMVKT